MGGKLTFPFLVDPNTEAGEGGMYDGQLRCLLSPAHCRAGALASEAAGSGQANAIPSSAQPCVYRANGRGGSAEPESSTLPLTARPGRKPPFLAVKRPARPHKTATESRSMV